MPVSETLRVRLPGAVRRRLLAPLAVVAAGACMCGEGPGLQKGGPSIKVEPADVVIEGIPQKYTEFALKVTNEGNAALRFAGVPYFVESDGDTDVEYAVLEAGRFRTTCEGASRSDPDALAPKECATLVFRYVPAREGVDEALLRFESNDGDKPVYDVPIHGSALTPDIEVCNYNGETLVDCNENSVEYLVDYGISPPGALVERTLKIRSKGTRSLVFTKATLTGDSDFTAEVAAWEGRSLDAGTEQSLVVQFNALTGGPREAQLVLTTNDPDESPLLIQLSALGDGAKLCVSAEDLSFGQVAVGATAEKMLRFASCGTKPLTLTTLALTDGAPVFAATFPALPKTMNPGDPIVDVPVKFAPPAADRYSGRINIATDTEQGYVLLDGAGVESGCKLGAPTLAIDFGQVGARTEARRDFTVANRGTAVCVLPAAPHIVRGADVRFALAGFPAALPVLAPGEILKFSVSYTPQDATGPDEGEMAIPFAEDAPNAQTRELRVQLKGNPTAEPKCVLTALPGTASAFGRSLNFGQVRVGQEKVMPVTFQNTGSIQCTIQPARVAGTAMPGMPNDTGAFTIKKQPKSPLLPGETTTVDVAMVPPREGSIGSPFGGSGGIPGFPGGGAFGVTLYVNTSDTVSFPGTQCATFGGGATPGCVSWSLTGEGVRSDLQVLPSQVEFGLVTLGCRSREQNLMLYNVGAAVITIKSIRVDPAQTPGNETFKVTYPPTPFTIPGGQQKAITVRYRPPDATIHTAAIFIESDATNVTNGNPYISVPLRGEGTTNSHQTDTFDQSDRPKSDVLFVIDNSGSMSEEQNALAANAQTFLQTAQRLNTDFQIGVTTTDMENEAGLLVGSPKIIRPGASAASEFSRAIKRGTNGSATEKGLAAMNAALTDPLITDANKNGGFLRTDAKLAVIVVSDEEDQSSGTVDFYTDFLKSLKGSYNAGMVSLSAVVGDEATAGNAQGGCSSSNGSAAEGARYIAVQQRTGGKFRSICAPDWGQIAAELGLDAFGSRAGYPLSRVADPAKPMTVTVGGARVDPPAWSYDPASNSIVFDAAHLPAPGTSVVIDYETLCL